MSLTTVDQGLLGTYAQYTGFKNRLINGSMTISQRNGTNATANNSNAYCLDRWAAYGNAASKYTTTQSTTAPAGFYNSLLVTSSAATTVASGDYYFLVQKIEGYNVADFNLGTANAKPFTVSFWVRSSLTGTFGGSLLNGGSENYTYPFTYTISAANTWEYKTITVAGPTAGTWLTGTSAGLEISFGLGVGSSLSGTAGSWSANSYYSATGATSVVGTNGATFYLTGVQLEVGSTATSFDYRPYGTELALCQRYYETNQTGGLTSYNPCAYYEGLFTAGALYSQNIPFCVQKRATPTMTYVHASATIGTGWGYYTTGWNNGTSTTNGNISTSSFSVNVSASLTGQNSYLIDGAWSASAEL
jgi:hypothetical protein